MKKNEKWKVKIGICPSTSKKQKTKTTGLPPDKSSFFTFYFSFFNFQYTVIVLHLFILFSFSHTHARQFAKTNDTMLFFFHLDYSWQPFEKNDPMLVFPFYHSRQSAKENDMTLLISYYEQQSVKTDDIMLFFPYYYARQSMKRDDMVPFFPNLYAQKEKSQHHAYAQRAAMTGHEYRVQVGFIYNFAKFTKWRSDAFEKPDSAIKICLVSDRFNKSEVEAISALNGKYIRNRKIIVKNKNKSQHFMPLLNTIVKKDDLKDDLKGCHILFINSNNKEFVQKQLKEVGNRNILTIGETEDFTQMCGIIRLFQTENRLRFEVNLGAAERAGLKLGAPLLMSAEIIKDCQR